MKFIKPLIRRIDGRLAKIPLLNILSSKKSINISILNRLGIQPFRIWLSSKRYNIRPKYLSNDILSYVHILQKEGIVVIPNFLPQDVFDRLETECKNVMEKEKRTVERQDGPNLYTNINSDKLQSYPEISSVFRHKKIEKLFKAMERRDISLENIVTLFECLIQGEENGTIDPESNLHEDIFFNTHKAWLYITDVETHHAPFVYVKESNSHSMTDRYHRSYKYSLKKDNIHSRRISNSELTELGLHESVFTAKKNTFVMANTIGFHRRLRGEPGNKRISLAFSARFNPFF